MIIRKLVTQLSYSIDKSQLIEYKRSATKVAKSLPKMFNTALGSSMDQIKQMSQQARNSVKLNAQKAREILKAEKANIQVMNQYRTQYNNAKKAEHNTRINEYRELFNQIKRNGIEERKQLKEIEALKRSRISRSGSVASTSFHLGAGALGAGAVVSGGTGMFMGGAIDALVSIKKDVAKFKALRKNDQKGIELQKMIQDFTVNESTLDPEAVGRIASKLITTMPNMSNTDVINELRKLADVALGDSLAFELISAQFAQGIAKGKPELEDLKTLGDHTVGILDAIAKVMGTDIGGVFKASGKGQITKEIFEEAFNNIAEDRKGVQAKMMAEVGGQIQVMKNESRLMQAEFAEVLLPEIMSLISFVRKGIAIVRSLPDFIKRNIIKSTIVVGFFATITGAMLMLVSGVANIQRLILSLGIGESLGWKNGGWFFGGGGGGKGTNGKNKGKGNAGGDKQSKGLMGWLGEFTVIKYLFDGLKTVLIRGKAQLQLFFWYMNGSFPILGQITSKLTVFRGSIGGLLARFLGVLNPVGILIGAFTLLYEVIFKLIPWLERPQAGDTFKKGKMLQSTATSADQFYYRDAKNKGTGVISQKELNINVVSNLQVPEGTTQFQKQALKKIVSDTFKDQLTKQFIGLQADTVGVR